MTDNLDARVARLIASAAALRHAVEMLDTDQGLGHAVLWLALVAGLVLGVSTLVARPRTAPTPSSGRTRRSCSPS
jgi:hypothetical protein